MIGRTRRRPDLAVASGERLLAWAPVESGHEATVVGGTRDALYLPDRVPWEQVATATWDDDERVLRVVVLAPFGEPQPIHLLPLREPGRLLQLVRERVTASMALQRHVPVGAGAIRVVARRAPSGRGEVVWLVDYDAAVDPADPSVAEQVQRALVAAQDELGA